MLRLIVVVVRKTCEFTRQGGLSKKTLVSCIMGRLVSSVFLVPQLLLR